MSVLDRKKKHLGVTEEKDNVLTVSLQKPEESEPEVTQSLQELERLIDTLGGKVIGTYIQRREAPNPATYIGKGKAEELGRLAQKDDCSLIAFDTELTGNQIKNLEKITCQRVIDRTALILEIFSRHARSKEAKVQVEIASLEYMSSRLTRQWTHLERQRGGIGMKGVGEKQIELDRRIIRERVAKLREELRHIEENRASQSWHRDRFLKVAIVGYTNAGKSTLMNRLTHSEVYVDDRVFATLDPTVRVIDPKTRPPILLSDTVGFINKLPHSLIASFRSTLREALEAELLLHIVDLSSPHYRDQMDITQKVLDEIGAKDKPMMLVFNKADQVSEVFLPKILERKYIDSIVVSSLREEDMKRLRDHIYRFFEREMMELDLTIPYSETLLQSQLHEFSKVLEKKYLEQGTYFRVRIMRSDASWLKLLERTDTKVL